MKTLYIVVPCYNEEEVLPETILRLTSKLNELIKTQKISQESRMLFVNDGSKDRTWEIIENQHKNNPMVCGLKLSRNKGHQNALLAGLLTARNYADMVISMDADLQDDIEVISSFVDEFYKGNDIVYGVRKSREKDTFFKKNTALMYYKFINFMGVEVLNNHADYRLMSKRAIDSLEQFSEVNLFLRGIVPMIGYSSSIVYYNRDQRFAGESKYPLKKMLAFAFEGITSFTIKPIRFITWIGFMVFLMSFGLLIYFFLIHYLGYTVQGWTTLVISVWALGGLQLLGLGIVGEYVGKIYMETKKRPRFLIDEILIEKE